MPLETGVTTVEDLNPSWPTGTDPKSEGDDHLRNIKTAVINSDAARQTSITDLEGRMDAAETNITNNFNSIVNLFENQSHGRVLANGTLAGGTQDWSVAKVGTGQYRITFTKAAVGVNHHTVTANAEGALNFIGCSVNYLSSTEVEVFCINTGSQSVTDWDFGFIRAMR